MENKITAFRPLVQPPVISRFFQKYPPVSHSKRLHSKLIKFTKIEISNVNILVGDSL